MTDIPVPADRAASVHTSDEARKRLARRYTSERRFKYIGLGAVLVAAMFLVLLLSTVIGQALPAFTYNYLRLPLDLSVENVDPAEPGQANFMGIMRAAIDDKLPFVEGRSQRRLAHGLVSGSAEILVREQVIDNPDLLGGTRDVPLLVSDTVDLYYKGLIVAHEELVARGEAAPTATNGEIEILVAANAFSEIVAEVKEMLTHRAERASGFADGRERSLARLRSRLETLRGDVATATGDRAARLQREVKAVEGEIPAAAAEIARHRAEADDLFSRAEDLGVTEAIGDAAPSYFIYLNGGVVKVTHVASDRVRGEVFIPLSTDSPAATGAWRITRLARPEASRKISDREIVYADHLRDAGLVERRLNAVFFTRGASREPEFAGIWGAVVGSFLTMIVTLALAFPLGVAAAIYLEEFAVKNRWTALIEVNINNLAAVPSIVFGLLGLAVFLNFFGLPRSAPLVGGMVLALMTLPTIIIAARAALKAVPPSIREAALGIGASRIQTVFHHVLPLAMPGILTGTIIGMAQALGETAPLLMIGMVAFIVDIPGGFVDPSTVLPVQIFMWADFPEQGFQQKTAAAILVLLGFLVIMNAAAVLLRRRFERRW